MRRALLVTAVLLASSPSVWGQAPQYDRQTLLRVLLATDAAQVVACERLGIVRDSSPEDLRKKILRLGGDAGLVTFDSADPDKMNAEVYRCQKKAPAARRVATGDPSTDHGPLLGTWAGTLRSPTIVFGRDRPSQLPTTVRMWEEGGQLHWTMEVDAGELNGQGTGTYVYGEVTLTGTYGPNAQPITYSLKLNGQMLQGTGVGADNLARTLSLRKRR
ncbi:MAG TPA: hypothetical protein VFU40_03900 [Gemmatimonadales bacterium]|nr:hypothetical protein [Gemmatimonadales bacterium]